MLLLGALVGAIFAKLAVLILPGQSNQAQVLAVLGMAAFFVGSVRAPLTGIVLISEMTGGYDLLIPICIACLGAYLDCRGIARSTDLRCAVGSRPGTKRTWRGAN